MYSLLDSSCYKEIHVRKKKKGYSITITGPLATEAEPFDLTHDNAII